MTYPDAVSLTGLIRLNDYRYKQTPGTIGIIGAGNFTSSILLPALKSAGGTLKTIASAGGLNAAILAKKYSIGQSTTDYRQILNDSDIDLFVIATRHDSHARLTVEALQAGKHVFVEKPLAIYTDELPLLISAQQASGKLVMVGFNRRFSPFTQKMKKLLGSPEIAINVVITINAGFIPTNSWVHNRAVGGGRILGEVGHFIDLITYLTGSFVRSVCINAMGQLPTETSDSASLLLRYENGSTGVINYFSNGSNAYPKERIEVYSQERTLILDNFRQLTGYGFKGFSRFSGRQDKGHTEQMKRLIEQVRNGGNSLIPFAELMNTTQTTLGALQSLRENRWIDVAGIGLSQTEAPV
ncbi:Gfo/Idh/MocA family oxidoreductase [Spirosoma telluris]|uniref:Gfo/Idh/MocA family protein n=1 Tax=Spirosoma telluris TaxID=2183553 RepID=UPI002FC3D0B0